MDLKAGLECSHLVSKCKVMKVYSAGVKAFLELAIWSGEKSVVRWSVDQLIISFALLCFFVERNKYKVLDCFFLKLTYKTIFKKPSSEILKRQFGQ